jgi:hypothetical protein
MSGVLLDELVPTVSIQPCGDLSRGHTNDVSHWSRSPFGPGRHTAGYRTHQRHRLTVIETSEEISMSKRARKRRDRKKTGPNHGKRPNC